MAEHITLYCDICYCNDLDTPARGTVAYTVHRDGRDERRALDLCQEHLDSGRPLSMPAVLLPEVKALPKRRPIPREPREAKLARGIARYGPERLTCEVCGYLSAAPTGLGAHKRYLHGINGAPRGRRAEVASA